jgi:hypothetical protein
LRIWAAQDPREERAEEERLLGFVKNHFNDLKVDKHAKRVDWHNLTGFEIFGTGKEKNAAKEPGRFFAAVLFDKKDSKKGVVIAGTGTLKGFEKHHPGIYEALHTMRAY